MATTKIEWCTDVWNPLRGCSRVSAGCERCYAERHAARFSGPGQPFEGVARLRRALRVPRSDLGVNVETGEREFRRAHTVPAEPRWTGEVFLIAEKLTEPLRWRRPRRVFVNSMSDLFHDKVPDQWIEAVFGVMLRCPQHTFQVLTKRPARMRDFMNGATPADCLASMVIENPATCKRPIGVEEMGRIGLAWPPPNVWLGTSVENQETADERVPLLLRTPAAVRWVSLEPLLGPVELHEWMPHRYTAGIDGSPCRICGIFTNGLHSSLVRSPLDWVVVGGESGPGARPCDPNWIHAVVAQCRDSDVPAFVKQCGSNIVGTEDYRVDGARVVHFPDEMGPRCVAHRKGGDPAEWPEELRVREYPREHPSP